jgi:hypothetical protein
LKEPDLEPRLFQFNVRVIHRIKQDDVTPKLFYTKPLP